MTTRTSLAAIVLMLTAATLVVVAVGTFAATTRQAQTESESSSTTCINDQPCQTTVSNSTHRLSENGFADNKD
jgi:hypothetical protein